MARPIKSGRERGLAAALDIGAAKVACVIAELTPVIDGEFEADVIGVGQHGSVARERREDLEASLRAAVETAERMAGDDVADCLAHGAAAAAPEGSTALHAFKVRYAIDGESTVEDPVGLAGSVLNAEILGVSVRDSHVANVESLLGQCGLELEELVAGPYAAAEAVLIDDEKDLGVLMLDLGARSTDFALFERGALIACGGAQLGGDHITRDIAQIFGAPIAKAERIKTLHGSLLAGPGDEHRLIDFPQLGDEGEIARHSRAELIQVIVSRFEEIIELALEALPKGGGARRAIRRAVLTGGGSLLVGAREAAERMIGVKTRLGRPAALSGAPEAATAPQFATAVGLLKHVASEKARAKRASVRPRLATVGAATGRGFIGSVGAWLKANF